jgi:hypothetical protein
MSALIVYSITFAHQAPVFVNAEDFRAVFVNSQHPYSVVVTVNSSIPVDPCFSRDNQIA